MTAISVVIPIHNVEKYLKECLDSIINQTFKDFEVICVDDCSNDSTPQILDEYSQKDNRIRIIKNEVNKGVSASRNIGMDAAVGEYLIFVDSDDWLNLNAFEKIYNKFEETGADNVWYNSYYHNGEEVIKPMYLDTHILHEDGFYEVTAENFAEFTDFVWDKAYRLSKLREINVRFPEGLIFEDAEFCFKILTKLKRFYFIHDILYNYRVREGSIVTTGRKGEGHVLDIFTIFDRIVDYAKEAGIFHEYRLALLYMLGTRVYSIKLPNQRTKALKLTKAAFEKIGFPEGYEELDNDMPDKLFYGNS